MSRAGTGPPLLEKVRSWWDVNVLVGADLGGVTGGAGVLFGEGCLGASSEGEGSTAGTSGSVSATGSPKESG